MSAILAIDPGSQRSAAIRVDDGVPYDHDIYANDVLLERLRFNDSGLTIGADVVVVEWMTPRGLPTSAQEFETLYWIGRFIEAAAHRGFSVRRLARDEVKYRLCGRRSKVNDANVRAALIDRFGGIGGKAAAVGTRAAPGPLHGIRADIWQALGLAIAYAEGGS